MDTESMSLSTRLAAIPLLVEISVAGAGSRSLDARLASPSP